MINIKHKKIYFFLTIIQLLLTCAIFALNYMKFEKMGIVRHITFYNELRFKNFFTSEMLTYIVYLFLVLAVLNALILFITRKNFLELILSGIFFIFASYYTFNYNVEKEFIYYYIVIYFLVMSLIELLKMVTLKFKK